MSKWTAIKSKPWLSEMVNNPTAELSGRIEWYSSNDPYKYWALFEYRVDGTASVKSYCGKFEDECHGATYTQAAVAQFRQRLLEAGFTVSDQPGDMRNIF